MPMRAPSIRGCCGRRLPKEVMCPCQQARKREADKAYDAGRPSASRRGYDAEWRTLRKAYLAEPGHQLCACGAPATLVGHIVSIRQAPGRRLDRSNWKPSCTPCNLRQNIRCEGGFGKATRG